MEKVSKPPQVKAHGGPESQGRRKARRPLSKSLPLHISLRSQKARGDFSMASAKHKISVLQIVRRQSSKFQVRIAVFKNTGQQLDLILQASHRENFQKFLISITALIARKVTGARRGRVFGKFWDHLAFSQVLNPIFYLQQLSSDLSRALMRRHRVKKLWNSSS